MGKDSAIAWTDHTFNPWWGCARVSPGCEHCYAELLATVRHKLPVWGVDAERKPMSEAYWRAPLKWNREAEKAGVRRRVFCASMADVFELLPERNAAGRAVQDAARARLWPLIEATPHLDWLLLTKRPENVIRLVPWGRFDGPGPDWYPAWPKNVWLGTTVEDQRRADERIPILLSIPARVRFVSAEPLLEPVDLGLIGTVARSTLPRHTAVHELIDWVIVGGESGPGARPFDLDWARDIVGQCKAAGVACFVKQLGSRPESTNKAAYLEAARRGSSEGLGRSRAISLRDRKGGDPAEWPPILRVREWPEVSP